MLRRTPIGLLVFLGACADDLSPTSIPAGAEFGDPFAHVALGDPECLTRAPTEAEIASLAGPATVWGALRAAGSVAIPVDFHIITSGGVGDVSAQAAAQVAALNDGYNGGGFGGAATPFTFVLRTVQVVENPTWFTTCLEASATIGAALRTGGKETLNVFTCNSSYAGNGWSFYPWDAPRADDGIWIRYSRITDATPGMLGTTAIHEAGHWLGLYHTFNGGCNKTGDYVNDTPPEMDATTGCPASKDSCRSKAGLDPIHNFMDYADDTCRWDFTAGQATRMDTSHAQYR